MWGRASEGSGGKEGGGDLRLGGRGEGKGGWSGVERSGWGRGGPLSALEPGTIERGGFGQCRCRGRAGPQGYVQSQGRPRGTADPSRKAVSRNRPPCEDRRTIKARSHLRLCSIGFSSVCCIVRMIDPAAFLQGYFCDHVCCRLPFAVCRLPFAVGRSHAPSLVQHPRSLHHGSAPRRQWCAAGECAPPCRSAWVHDQSTIQAMPPNRACSQCESGRQHGSRIDVHTIMITCMGCLMFAGVPEFSLILEQLCNALDCATSTRMTHSSHGHMHTHSIRTDAANG